MTERKLLGLNAFLKDTAQRDDLCALSFSSVMVETGILYQNFILGKDFKKT